MLCARSSILDCAWAFTYYRWRWKVPTWRRLQLWDHVTRDRPAREAFFHVTLGTQGSVYMLYLKGVIRVFNRFRPIAWIVDYKHFLACDPQRSNTARVRNVNRFNGGKLPGNSKHFFKRSEDKAFPGKRSFKCWVSVEKFLFVSLWLNRLVLCFVTVFPAKLSYELRSVNALNWYRFSRHWQPDVT